MDSKREKHLKASEESVAQNLFTARCRLSGEAVILKVGPVETKCSVRRRSLSGERGLLFRGTTE